MNAPTSPGWYFLAVPDDSPILVRVRRDPDGSLAVYLPSPGPGWLALEEMQWQAAQNMIPLNWSALPSVKFTERKTANPTIAGAPICEIHNLD